MKAKSAKTLLIAMLILFPQIVAAANWQWMAPRRAYSLVKEGSGLWLVDVRSPAAFTEGHVEGAVNIPAGFMATKRLPHGKIIVIVDDSLGLREGRMAAETLLKKGNDKVFLLEGGMASWRNEGYPVTGAGGGYRCVKPEEISWALENRIPLRIYDLRDKGEQAQGPVRQAQAVAGKDLAERLRKAQEMLKQPAKKGVAAKLEKPPTIILVFPSASDPRPILEKSFRGVSGDVRCLEGGYAAWAAKPEKKVSTVGACPTCPGGKK